MPGPGNVAGGSAPAPAAEAAPADPRLFVAVWPPPVVVEAVEAVAEALRRRAGDVPAGAGDTRGASAAAIARGLRWTDPADWHVTLRFLGQVDHASAVGAFGAIERQARPVVARVGPNTGRFGRRVLHVPVQGLEELAAAAVAATSDVGEPADDRPFAGHLTLARARARGGADLSSVVGVPVSAVWEVEEITLVASRPGATGAGVARYEVVASAPVR